MSLLPVLAFLSGLRGGGRGRRDHWHELLVRSHCRRFKDFLRFLTSLKLSGENSSSIPVRARVNCSGKMSLWFFNLIHTSHQLVCRVSRFSLLALNGFSKYDSGLHISASVLKLEGHDRSSMAIASCSTPSHEKGVVEHPKLELCATLSPPPCHSRVRYGSSHSSLEGIESRRAGTILQKAWMMWVSTHPLC